MVPGPIIRELLHKAKNCLSYLPNKTNWRHNIEWVYDFMLAEVLMSPSLFRCCEKRLGGQREGHRWEIYNVFDYCGLKIFLELEVGLLMMRDISLSYITYVNMRSLSTGSKVMVIMLKLEV